MVLKEIFGIKDSARGDIPASKRRSGFVEAEKPPFEYINEAIYKTQVDHIVGTSAQVTSGDANVKYVSASTEFQDINGSTVTFTDGDRILWAGLDTLTADIDISTIDDLTHIMVQGVTLAFGAQDLNLGENQRGELNISGTGDLDVLSSDLLNVKTSGVNILNQSGDIFIDSKLFIPSAGVEINELESYYVSATTLDVKTKALKLLKSDNTSVVVNDIDETFNISTDLYGGSERNSTWYDCWIGADVSLNLERLLVPNIPGTTDGVNSFKLIDSTADFVTDNIAVGDVVYNNTDNAKTVVTNVDSLTTLSVEDDIFVSGDDYTIRILSPVFSSGYDYKAFVKTSVYNDSSGDFDNFHNRDGKTYIPYTSVLVSGTASTLTAVDISATVPPLAKSCIGIFRAQRASGQDSYAALCPVSDASIAESRIGIATNVATNDAETYIYYNMLLVESQNYYYRRIQCDTVTINVIGYEL